MESTWIQGCLNDAGSNTGESLWQPLWDRRVPAPPERGSRLLIDVMDQGIAAMELPAEKRRFMDQFRSTELRAENVADFLRSIFL